VNGSGEKKLTVGGVDYVINENADTDIETIVAQIEQALNDRTVVKVPVLNSKNNAVTLYLNGGQVDAVVIDVDEIPRPGEISPH
jgi:hypothetical protein